MSLMRRLYHPSYYCRVKTNCAQTAQLQFSREELLAATQAQLIYIIMRVIDNSKPEADLNREILASFLVQPLVPISGLRLNHIEPLRKFQRPM